MKDCIKVSALETFGNHGVFPEENILGQKFVVTAELYTNTREAGQFDELTKSIHYGEVAHEINNFMKEHTFKLIESVAEQLSLHLLLKFPLIDEILIEVKKPWAPIGLPLESASVTIKRGWHQAYIALGSNMGDSQAILTEAIDKLTKRQDCRVEKVSNWLKTAPYGGVEQDDFLNGCAAISTLLPPRELLKVLNDIEQEAGRERLIRWGPRTLDLDILLYDDLVMYTDDLMIPHIDMHNRDFVLTPLVEIAPYAYHPVKQMSVLDLRATLES